MNKIYRIIYILILTFISINDLPAQIIVIVNMQNSISSLSLNELKEIYTADVVQWESVNGYGEYITLLDYKRKSEVADKYFMTVANLSHAKIRLEWIGKMLTGKIQRVPIKCSSENELIKCVPTNAGAIGFVDVLQINKLPHSVKIVKINNKNFTNTDYPFSLNQFGNSKTKTLVISKILNNYKLLL